VTRGGRLVAAATWVCLAGACGPPDPAVLGMEGRDPLTLEAVYPPGTPRAVVRAREAEVLVFSIHACDFGAVDRDAALARALEAFRRAHPGVTPSCDRLRLARPGWATLLGGLAYYQDYVFYDADDQVLVAYRTYIQR